MANYAQHATKDAASATSTTLAFGGATTAGNLIVVAIRVGGTSTCAVTDDGASGGNNYAAGSGIQGSDVGLAHAAFGTVYIFSSAQTSKSATTLTFTLTGGAATMRIAIYEYANIATTTPLDKTSSLYTTSGTAANSGNTATTTQATELLVGAMANNLAETITAGTTQSYLLEDGVPAAASSRLGVEDVLVTATGAFQADFTGSATSDRIALIATYKNVVSATFIAARPFVVNQAVNRAGTY